MREKQKTKKLMNRWLIIYWIACLILIFGFIFILRACEKDTNPAMAAEVSLPILIREEVPANPASTMVVKELRIDDIRNEIIQRAQEYRIDIYEALAIAFCESTFNAYAKNPASTAKGVYQFTDPTWKWIKAEGHQFDYKENIRQFMIWYQVYPGWWKSCLNKLAID
jgi:soluble lytic murein transglycosylase-like protein